MKIKGEPFTLEIAATDKDREHGLMERDPIPANYGMIFIMDAPGLYPFWMHHTRFPLDIIWLSPDAKVVYITTMQAYDEHPQGNTLPAQYIIELNAGTAQKLSLQIGDTLTLPQKLLKTITPPAEK